MQLCIQKNFCFCSIWSCNVKYTVACERSKEKIPHYVSKIYSCMCDMKTSLQQFMSVYFQRIETFQIGNLNGCQFHYKKKKGTTKWCEVGNEIQIPNSFQYWGQPIADFERFADSVLIHSSCRFRNNWIIILKCYRFVLSKVLQNEHYSQLEKTLSRSTQNSIRKLFSTKKKMRFSNPSTVLEKQ